MNSRMRRQMVFEQERLAALVAPVWALLHCGGRRCRHHRVGIHQLRL